MTDAQSTLSFADKMKAAKAAKKAAVDQLKADVAKVKAELKAKKVGVTIASPARSKKLVEAVRAKVASPARSKKLVEAVLVAADKRLKGALKVHGVSEKQATKVVADRRAKLALAQKAADAVKKANKPEKPVVQATVEGPHGPPTIARSYKREFRGNGATLRGKMLQVTVTFTADQFNVLKERAEMYGASLSETVRKCVMSGPLSIRPKV
jgi:hypothetical protein